MNRNDNPITISNKSTIIPRKEEKSYTIPRSDWVFLKEKIKRIKSPQLLWYTIGSALLGIAGSSGLTAILCKNSWIGLICAITLTGGIFSLLLAKEQRKTVVNSQMDALIEMQRIEDKHEEEVISAYRKLRKDIEQLAIKEQSKENSEASDKYKN
jgi:proteasome assembly chaperone (PAC2) family protein